MVKIYKNYKERDIVKRGQVRNHKIRTFSPTIPSAAHSLAVWQDVNQLIHPYIHPATDSHLVLPQFF
jgi:hypothetical protein